MREIWLNDDLVDVIAEEESKMQTASLEFSCATRPRQNNQWFFIDVFFDDLLKAHTGPSARPGIVAAASAISAKLSLEKSWNDVKIEFVDYPQTNAVTVEVQNHKSRDMRELQTASGKAETMRAVFEAIRPMLKRLLSKAGLFRIGTDTLRLTTWLEPPWDPSNSRVPRHRVMEGRVDVVRPATAARKAELRRVLGTR